MPEFMNPTQFIDYRFARYTVLDGKSYDGSSRKGVDADGHPHYIIKDADTSSAFLMRKGGTSYKDSKLYEEMMDPDFSGYGGKTMSRARPFSRTITSVSPARQRPSTTAWVSAIRMKATSSRRTTTAVTISRVLSMPVCRRSSRPALSFNMAYSVTEDFCTDASFSPYVNAFYFNPFVSPYDENGKLYTNPGAKAAFGSSAQFTSTVNAH